MELPSIIQGLSILLLFLTLVLDGMAVMIACRMQRLIAWHIRRKLRSLHPQPAPTYVVFRGLDQSINTGYRATTRPQADAREDVG
jgi:hypothetical protein